MGLPRPIDDDVDDSLYLFDWGVSEPRTPKFWTADKVETLTQMWHASWVVRDIAKRLGCTRNAVIGKADRLGLPRRDRTMYLPKKSPKHKAGRAIRLKRMSRN
jgi:hypothetical protein